MPADSVSSEGPPPGSQMAIFWMSSTPLEAGELTECRGTGALSMDVVGRACRGSLMSDFRFSVEHEAENKADTEGLRTQQMV